MVEFLRKNTQSRIRDRLDHYITSASGEHQPVVEGKLVRMVGLTLVAVGCRVAVGGRCKIINQDRSSVEAEVVGFAGEEIFLMPTGRTQGLAVGARVIPTEEVSEVSVGYELLGRVIDGNGVPLDSHGPVQTKETFPLSGRAINPLQRHPIDQPLDVGIQAINSLLTVGRGQRIGLFAGSGVGKSVLLGMMTKHTDADITVVCLVGERGREVSEFVQKTLGEEGLKQAVVVAVPADFPPLLRLQGAMLATSIAEYFRDKGEHVLLLMDSLTRFAQAQREIGLAINEPPTTKGYPPSAFAILPQLVERAGNGREGGGSITAFYTVLAEGDDQNDPVVDAARAILDGHIVLTRELADSGHYPAIDVEQSVSRAMSAVVEKEHLMSAMAFKKCYSTYTSNRDLISVGAYQKGADPELDRAVDYYPAMMSFLTQKEDQSVSYEASLKNLAQLMA